MARAYLDVATELVPVVSGMLPRGVNVVESEPYGGSYRLTIEGNGLPDGADMQLVIVDEPMRRIIELKAGGQIA